MRILSADGDWLEVALEVIRSGGVVAHATETCYGLACDIGNQQAVARLFRVKRRPENQPVSALFTSISHAQRYVEWPQRAAELAGKYLPGPLTLVLPLLGAEMRRIFPMPKGGKTIGVRISPHPVARMLAEAYGEPLTTTSANIHGEPNPYSVSEILRQFEMVGEQPDVIVDSGVLPQNPPSQVIDLTAEEERILRPAERE